MRAKKSSKKIYGAEFTATERKAMNMEIQRQLADYDEKHKLELQALVLWQLHEQFGFGVKRLRKFYENFNSEIEALIERYQLEESDGIWLCTIKLKDIGADIEEWDREEG